jgi:hypothetical protein
MFRPFLRIVCQLDFVKTSRALAHQLNKVAALVNGAADNLKKHSHVTNLDNFINFGESRVLHLEASIPSTKAFRRLSGRNSPVFIASKK